MEDAYARRRCVANGVAQDAFDRLVAVNYCDICNFESYASSIMGDPAQRTAHIKDAIAFFDELDHGQLPAVAFLKTASSMATPRARSWRFGRRPKPDLALIVLNCHLPTHMRVAARQSSDVLCLTSRPTKACEPSAIERPRQRSLSPPHIVIADEVTGVPPDRL